MWLPWLMGFPTDLHCCHTWHLRILTLRDRILRRKIRCVASMKFWNQIYSHECLSCNCWCYCCYKLCLPCRPMALDKFLMLVAKLTRLSAGRWFFHKYDLLICDIGSGSDSIWQPLLQDLKWLQTITSLPILLKGVLTAEDGKHIESDPLWCLPVNLNLIFARIVFLSWMKFHVPC